MTTVAIKDGKNDLKNSLTKFLNFNNKGTNIWMDFLYFLDY